MRPTLLRLFPLLLLSATSAPTTAPAPPGYHLVWSDEFSADGPLNPADWSFEKGFVRNNELQFYQPANASCKAGILTIEARREKVPNLGYDPASKDWRRSRQFADYSSASATTRNHHAFLYGRFEIRARIDTRQGSWPAFWTLGAAQPWPACGEVDIMEFYKSTLLANVAWQGKNNQPAWHTVKTPLKQFTDADPDWSTRFHTWRMDWDEKHIALSVDDQLLNTTDLTTTLNTPTTRPGTPAAEPYNPFHHPMYLLLNLAIGSNGGDPAPTPFPLKYEIDYLRIYQKNTP